MTLRERVRNWLFPKDPEAEIMRLEALIETLRKEGHPDAAVAPEPEKKDKVRIPFRINREPGRKLRAKLEWENSPEFKQVQAKQKELKAVQPQGAANGR